MFLTTSIKKTALSVLLGISICGLPNCSYASEESNAVYELYPTENIYNLLELNTRDGRIAQIQYGINDNGERMKVAVNTIPLVLPFEEQNGRFKLYPTKNMYTFILLDSIDGRTWQVQWHTKPENRGIIGEIKEITK